MPDLSEDASRLLAVLVESSRTRKECAAIIGDPVRSAAALTQLRDARLIAFDPAYGEWGAR